MPLRWLCGHHIRCRGFTLIELLAVLAIIGVLAGILVPALSRARREAHRALCACHLREIGQSLDMYVQDFNEWYPTAEAPGSKDAVAQPGASQPDSRNWWENEALLELLGMTPNPQGQSILTCPADGEPNQFVDGSFKDCWASYGANTSAFGVRRARSKRGRTRSQVPEPAKTMAFCDVRSESQAPHVVGWQPCVRRNFAFRHDERCTVVYVDTHVGWIRSEDVPLDQGAWKQPFWGNLPVFDRP